MDLEILRKLAGDEEEFEKGLVELGWFEFRPRLTPAPFLGKAKTSLNPCFKSAGQVKNTGAWVYRLELRTSKWRDAAAVVESQLKQEPQFAVVFCPLPDALIILVPENPEKAFNKEAGGLTVDKIYLDIRRPSNYEEEMIKKLQAAPGEQFRSQLQKLPDTEKVTKRFYEKFKDNLEEFKKLIAGISDLSDQTWYSSLMMNRLMFVYFLQRKGFLDGNPDYLADRLQKVKELRGRNKFQSFYRSFLRRLFHEGLGNKKREQDFEPLFGKIPYLNGGLFEVHEIESKYRDDEGQTLIDIPDTAFEKIFEFFDDFVWCLDTRPSRTEKEINPDVLGYIFEKYINQKQMGAYYTKEDITEYISKNTIIPCIFDKIKQKLRETSIEDKIWRLLQADPDRYIYEAVQKGVELDLPAEIAAGCEDVTKRGNWNTPAPEEYALPTEIWREVVARRKRYQEIRDKLAQGEVRTIDDLITYNLDIRRFAQDVIEQTDDPELVRAVWESMAGYTPQVGSNKKEVPPLTILDPTCGSGAFLFAALNILEPLYESCLERMEQFVAEADQNGETRKYPDFRHVLSRMNDREKHPNREYFILKSIILNNLYGVDIMPEAVEICKLRLFLKMAAVVEPDDARPNYGLEPLPDIDFNIRAGNTLVGFVSADEVRGVTAEGKPKQMTMFVESGPGEQMELIANTEESAAFKKIIEKLELADRQYEMFRRQQTELGGEVTAADKKALRKQLGYLENELNRYLAKQYNIDPEREKTKYQEWLISHQPFHWLIEFYGIMKRGGFDVIIGNPPYVEYRLVKPKYQIQPDFYLSESVNNLYAFCMERSSHLLNQIGRFGMIVPAGIVGLDDSNSLRKLLLKRYSVSFCSTYAIRPSKLFNGVDQRLCIYLASSCQSNNELIWNTRYHHWNSEEREYLFMNLQYVKSIYHPRLERISQVGNYEAISILNKLENKKYKPIAAYFSTDNKGFLLHYHRSPRYWIRGMDFEQYFKSPTRTRSIHHFRNLYFNDALNGKNIGAILNSTLFFFWFISMGNGRNITGTDVSLFPVGEISANNTKLLNDLFDQLMEDYKSNSILKVRNDCEFQEFYPSKSKLIIDRIDYVLAKHYSFTDEELDFIVNYDIKYRMGINGMEDEEDDE